jgi:hypothetical protein
MLRCSPRLLQVLRQPSCQVLPLVNAFIICHLTPVHPVLHAVLFTSPAAGAASAADSG